MKFYDLGHKTFETDFSLLEFAQQEKESNSEHIHILIFRLLTLSCTELRQRQDENVDFGIFNPNVPEIDPSPLI